jgi:TPR repeat protein
MYSLGKGVPVDMVKSYIWFSLSEEQGNTDAAKARELLVPGMTASQIGEAQALLQAQRK